MNNTLSRQRYQEKAIQLLQHHWGHSTFRPLQAEIITAACQGEDVVALMPTGGGKSICFQIPALLRPGLALVISPLIALMQDQVTQLNRRNVAAEALYQGMNTKERTTILERAIDGRVQLLYISPERLQSSTFRERLQWMKIGLVVVDEAHCISEWGHDFRPSYRQIATVLARLPKTPIMALTATATPQVYQDIITQLNLQKPQLFQQSFHRANLGYIVRECCHKRRFLTALLRKKPGPSIVYVPTRSSCEQLAHWLVQKGFHADYYHGGLDNARRQRKQTRWLRETIPIMVATNAFGMGIDKPNVGLVVHMFPPPSLEAYYQEAGRAGRDGKEAYAVLLYQHEDGERLRQQAVANILSEKTLRRAYQQLANHFQIAIGSSSGVTYSLDIAYFATLYGQEEAFVRQGLQALSHDGLIALEEKAATPSSLRILLDPRACYIFQIEHPVEGKVIAGLLHHFGHTIFQNLVPFSLEALAHQFTMHPKALATELRDLVALEVLSYTQADGSAQCTFLTPCYRAEDLPLHTALRRQRQEQKQRQIETFIDYLTYRQGCRIIPLLAYFGESFTQRCKCCDFCKASPSTTYTGLIKKILEKGPQSVSDLVIALDATAATPISRTVQAMIARGTLRYNRAWKVVLCTSKHLKKNNL